LGLRKVTRLLALASVLAFPLATVAQEGHNAATVVPGKPQTEPQKRGEALFAKHCPLCHIFTNQKKNLKIQASSDLVGLFKDSTISEDAVRQLIQSGIPKMMPGFKYTLEPTELDNLMAYLKIR
jgi:mono/diheme cytochrome c family protein